MFTGCARQPLLAETGTVLGNGCQRMLIQPLTQSAPIAGGTGVNVGSGVSVGGSGVDVGSPAGTVSVGTGVFATVEVAATVQVGRIGSVACVPCGWGREIKLLASSVM